MVSTYFFLGTSPVYFLFESYGLISCTLYKTEGVVKGLSTGIELYIGLVPDLGFGATDEGHWTVGLRSCKDKVD